MALWGSGVRIPSAPSDQKSLDASLGFFVDRNGRAPQCHCGGVGVRIPQLHPIKKAWTQVWVFLLIEMAEHPNDTMASVGGWQSGLGLDCSAAGSTGFVGLHRVEGPVYFGLGAIGTPRSSIPSSFPAIAGTPGSNPLPKPLRFPGNALYTLCIHR